MVKETSYVWADIQEQQSPGSFDNKGRYCFLQLPYPGDTINIYNRDEELEQLQVLTIEHTPAPYNYSTTPAFTPEAKIIVKLIRRLARVDAESLRSQFDQLFQELQERK
jgi:hypothetical protein